MICGSASKEKVCEWRRIHRQYMEKQFMTTKRRFERTALFLLVLI